jgi:hypothetical protein
MFYSLPDDIFFEIFSFLQGYKMQQIKIVCKKFNTIIKNNHILWEKVVKNTFQDFSLVYYKDYQEAYSDLFSRRNHKRANQTEIIRFDSKYNYNLTALDEKFKIQNELILNKNEEKNLNHASISPNGDFIAFSFYQTTVNSLREEVEEMGVYIKCLRPNNIENTGKNLMKIDTKKSVPFYYYWSPDGKYLSWIGNILNQNGLMTMGLWVFGFEDFLLKSFSKENTEIKNILHHFESKEEELFVECFDPIIRGRPIFYYWRGDKMLLHINVNELFIIQFEDQSSFDMKKLNFQLCNFSTPIFLNNEELIFISNKKIPNDKRQYDCVSSDLNGQITGVLYTFVCDSGNYFNSQMILSKDEKFLCISIVHEDQESESFFILIDLVNKKSEKIDLASEVDIVFFHGHDLVFQSNLRNWNFVKGGLIEPLITTGLTLPPMKSKFKWEIDILEYIMFYPQYDLSIDFISKGFF